MSNFTHIPSPFSSVMSEAIKAEQFVYDDPIFAGFQLRRALEAWVHWIYQNEPSLQLPYEMNLNAMMREPSFMQLFQPEMLKRMHTIRSLGNDAVHVEVNRTKINTEKVIHGLRLLHGISYYMMNLYSTEPLTTPDFDEDKIPLAQRIQQNILKSQIEEQRQKYEEEKRLFSETLKKQTEELQREIEALRLQNQTRIEIPKDPNEALTREIYIDELLVMAGWDISLPSVKEFRVMDMPNDSTIGYADYVLWGDDGKPLAVVEAKRTHRDAKVGQHQAELYAEALEKQFGQKPNIFLTNGYQIYFYDWEYPLREVQGFYTKEELTLNIQRRNTRKPLSSIVINEEITNRHYQQKAIKAVAERLEQRHRGALLVMATGTGKTRTAASIIDVLTRAHWVKRVLFLADRTALVSQAQQNLNDYLPTMSSVNLVKDKENAGSRLVFSTYQTLINLIDEAKTDENGKLYGVGHFDLIIFDEIHRSVYNKYKAIFEYFDGLKIGLTATPKETTDRNTYELFGLPFGNPTYNYDLDTATEEGYLVPYKSYSVQTKFLRDGIKYNELSEEDKKQYEEKFGDPITGEIPDEVEASALDNWLYNNDTADLILQTLMEKGIKVEEENTLGKTIIFCKNRRHAEFIAERFDANYPHYKGQFLKVIDYKTEYKEDELNNFRQKNKMPQIACSVDMMDTGIDVPEVVNLVFLKPVKSSIKFWQMIGRGTRLCKDLFGYQQDKKDFLILDFCQNFEFFEVNPKGTESSRQPSLNEKIFIIRLSLSQLFLAQEEEASQELGHQLLDFLHQQLVLFHTTEKGSFVVRPHLGIIEKFLERSQWDSLDKEDIFSLNENIAPIIIDNDKDTSAKIFDLLMYWLMSYHLEGNPKLKLCIDRVKSYAGKLQKQVSIPQVNAKLPLLKSVATEEYWQEISPKMLNHLREEMRELIKFLEKEDKPIVKTDIEDKILTINELKPIGTSFNKEAYERKIRQFIIENRYDLTIDKLHKNIKITIADLERLEEMLLAQGTETSREEFYKMLEGKPLGVFIRSVVGVDKMALKNAFAKISNYSQFNIKQMEFIDTIINSISQNGILEPKQINEDVQLQSIYTGSVIELFGMGVAQEVISVVREINDNGVAS